MNLPCKYIHVNRNQIKKIEHRPNQKPPVSIQAYSPPKIATNLTAATLHMFCSLSHSATLDKWNYAACSFVTVLVCSTFYL